MAMQWSVTSTGTVLNGLCVSASLALVARSQLLVVVLSSHVQYGGESALVILL